MTTTCTNDFSKMDLKELKRIYNALQEQGAYEIAEELSFVISAKVAQGVDEGTIKLHDRSAVDKIFAKYAN